MSGERCAFRTGGIPQALKRGTFHCLTARVKLVPFPVVFGRREDWFIRGL